MLETAQPAKRQIQLLIVDDEPLARQRLRDLSGDIGGYVVAGEAGNGIEALQQLQTIQADILLVDIRMPGMDGIELAQHVLQLPQAPALIFTTAYDHYALQAFDLNAVDYLLKPIRVERLAQALAKAKPLLLAQWQSLQALQTTHDHLSIHERGRVVLVPIDKVLYLRAELKYLTVRTAERSYLLEGSLTQLEQQHGQRFVRIHRNTLVARHAIAGFEKVPTSDGRTADGGWQVQLQGLEERLPISRRHQTLVKQF